MPSLPDFHDKTAFPSFTGCPLSDAASDSDHNTCILLATIHENMTLSSTPTFICKDRDSVSFALKINLAPNSSIENFEYKRFKKGFTVVVRDAKRGGVVGGKQGFIETRLDDIQIISASLQKLLAISSEIPRGLSDGYSVCQACHAEKIQEELLRCKGCDSAWYCNKECQIKGWGERGHKGDCKILKAVGGLGLGKVLEIKH